MIHTQQEEIELPVPAVKCSVCDRPTVMGVMKNDKTWRGMDISYFICLGCIASGRVKEEVYAKE